MEAWLRVLKRYPAGMTFPLVASELFSQWLAEKNLLQGELRGQKGVNRKRRHQVLQPEADSRWQGDCVHEKENNPDLINTKRFRNNAVSVEGRKTVKKKPKKVQPKVVDFSREIKRCTIQRVKDMIRTHGSEDTHVKAWPLFAKVVGVSVCADPEAALVNLFGGEFGVGNEGVDNDDRDIELTLEDDTAQVVVRVTGQGSTEAMSCHTGQIIFLKNVEYSALNKTIYGGSGLRCERVVNLGSIPGFLTADFVHPVSLSTIVSYKVQTNKSKSDQKSESERGRSVFNITVFRGLIVELFAPPNSNLVRRAHRTCGRQLRIEDDGKISELARCPFCQKDVDFREQTHLPAAGTALRIDDGVVSLQAVVLPKAMDKIFRACQLPIDRIQKEGPGIARKIVGREFLFRVHRIGDHFRIEDAVACNPSRIANSMVKELRVRRTALAKLTP
ncbi:hypothetical protein AAMO2058_001450400 [Amorphochlora amoebiformis]